MRDTGTVGPFSLSLAMLRRPAQPVVAKAPLCSGPSSS